MKKIDYHSLYWVNVIMFIIFAMLAFIITGCSKQPEYKIIHETKTVYVKPPSYLLKNDIEIPQPPNKLMFVKSRPLERERALTIYVIQLLKSIRLYRNKIELLNRWYIQVNEKKRDREEAVR